MNRLRLFFRHFHRDEKGNLVAISAVFVMVLVIMLTVVVNVAHVTHEKIQAQNAADAAALTGGVWQIRGMSFIQSLNNLVYVSDMLASFGLNVGVAGSVASAVDPTGAAQLIGNGGLVVCMGAHGFSQFALVPLRDIMNSAWPVISALGGSEMAKSNNARPIIGSLGSVAKGLALESAARNIALDTDSNLVKDNLLEAAGNWLWDLIADLDVYAIGMEINISQDAVDSLDDLGAVLADLKKAREGAGWEGAAFATGLATDPPDDLGSIKLAGLHLERVTEGSLGWPLVIPDSVIEAQLNFCSVLPLCNAAKGYFEIAGEFQNGIDKFVDFMTGETKLDSETEQKTGEMVHRSKSSADSYLGEVNNESPPGIKKWKHPYYKSEREKEEDRIVELPPSTWFAGGGVDEDAYSSRTAMWEYMLKGLGVPEGDGTYGQLGSLACASIVVKADTVEKYPRIIRGWVDLVPVHMIEGQDDSRELGICH